MTTIVLVEHNGNLKQIKTKDFSLDTLYKKCGFRNPEHFDKTTAWSVEHNKEIYNIELWAKNEGKANNENKYDFPPPVDNDLYYGTCALLRVDNKGTVLDLTLDAWVRIYEKLFGGFEDIVEEEADEEEMEEEEEEEPTKHGFIKDDFVVDDEEEEEDDDEDEEVDHKRKEKNIIVSKEEENLEEDYYGSELEEEAYSYSDED